MIQDMKSLDPGTDDGPFGWRSDQWLDDDRTEYQLRFHLGRVDGRLALTGLAIFSEHDKSAVTTKVIRKLPLGQKIKEWIDAEEGHEEWVAEDIKLDPFKRIPKAYAEHIQSRLTELTEKHERAKADPSSSLTFANFARIGAIYLASYRRGFSPTQFVADDQGISFNAATKRVLKAREFGFLPPPEAGRPSVVWQDLED